MVQVGKKVVSKQTRNLAGDECHHHSSRNVSEIARQIRRGVRRRLFLNSSKIVVYNFRLASVFRSDVENLLLLSFLKDV